MTTQVKTNSSVSRTVEKREEEAIRFHVRCCKRRDRNIDIILAQVNRNYGFSIEVDQIALNEIDDMYGYDPATQWEED